MKDYFAWLLAIFWWFAGIAVASADGFWMTISAILAPPWAWYLFVEKLVHLL